MSEIGIITTTESGVDLAVEWKIENFFNLPEEDGAWYWSPTFSFGGEEWFLRIWPNGWRECHSSGHVDLRLYKRSADHSIKQSFSLSLKTAKEEKYNEQNCTKDFGKKYPENYHASLRFIPRSELTMRRSELVPEGDVAVICMMKSSMSAESAMKVLIAKLLSAKSKIDELKLSYNQALQDKAEVQTKLGVLTNNFKHKEIELQRQLSAEEADGQKKEDDVNSAKRRIMLIEQENASYQSQVARLKQEMEEKERTFKSQIAAQEEKLDENRIAASAAERSLEIMEQEVSQLRQRLTLLEKEHENWASAATDEIVKPVPKISFNNPPEDCGFVTDINHLLKENRGIDVTFELETPNGKTKLIAHQLILAVMSSYFADEFYDKGRNKGHRVIPLKGINPKAFEQMIRYCYGENPSLITTEEVCSLFKVAFEFKVISLQNLCHTFFKQTKIEPGNVFSILKISVEMEDKSLQDMCFQILQEKTREVMAAYELCDITPAMVYTLLKSPKLSLNSEYELIKWIFEWAKTKSEDARDYLERLLKDMDFLALRFEEFAILCKDYQGFFNPDEIVSIYQNIAHTGTREMPEWFNNDLKSRVYTGSNQ